MADSPRAIVLAAGRGTRMRSELPKVLHPLGGRPLILQVVEMARAVTGVPPVVVVSPEQPAVTRLLGDLAECVEQPLPRGTGDALRSLPGRLRRRGPVLVLSGDVPLLRAATVERLLATHAREGVACTLLTVTGGDLGGLGRVVRDQGGFVVRVVEERDLGADEAVSEEGNAGVYVFEGELLWPALGRLHSDNAQGELYLTDVVALLAPAAAVVADDPAEVVGVNDRTQLASAEAELRRRTLEALMRSGVTIEDPATTYVDSTVSVGPDSVLRPLTVLRGSTRLGRECQVGPMAQLRDVVAGDRVVIAAAAIEESELEDDVSVGQFARLRPGTLLRQGTQVGTHAELKNSSVGPRATVSHFCCVLDSEVGADVNVGAGTVTCNYDGQAKHRTVIEDAVFLGSDSILVAPVRIGAGAYVGAGSVITRDVPAGALALERGEQRLVDGWVERRERRRAGLGEEV